MAQWLNMDMAAMPQFFRELELVCNSFCENQSAMDSAFNTVQVTWRDRNAVITHDRLEETARDISRFYDELNQSIEYILRVCNNRAEYIDYGKLTAPHIATFTIGITEITGMDSVINTRPETLEEFKAALDKYVQALVDNVERLRALYANIGESWDDAQYVKFGEALAAFRNRIQAQVDVLCKISAFLRSRIDILRRSDI